MNEEGLFRLVSDCERSLRKTGFAHQDFRSIRYEHDQIIAHFENDNFASALEFIKKICEDKMVIYYSCLNILGRIERVVKESIMLDGPIK